MNSDEKVCDSMQKNDVNEVFFLEKSGLIESITDMLLHLGIKTVCLDGRWGTGKTFFCKRLIKHLEGQSEAPLVLYMDCFEEDSVNEPLLSLMTLLYQAVDEDLKEKLANCVVRVLKASAVLGTTAAINMLIPGQGKVVVDELTKGNKSINLLERYSDKRKALDKLKGLLNSIVEKKNVVFILDELDRCRPDYALKVLENVKHIFNVNKVGFVFAVNETILKLSIAHVYGLKDCGEYLDKFFERRVVLPQGTGEGMYSEDESECRAFLWVKNKLCEMEKNMESGTNFILKGYEQCNNYRNEGVNVIVMDEVFQDNSRTIRDAEKVMRYVEFVYEYNKRPSDVLSRLYLIAILYVVYFHEEAYGLLTEDGSVVRVGSIARKVLPIRSKQSQAEFIISDIDKACEEFGNDRIANSFGQCLRCIVGLNNRLKNNE